MTYAQSYDHIQRIQALVSLRLLDKQVNARTASSAAQKAARSLSKGKASLALELVGYDEELSSAMSYVFGNAFVCKVSLECAPCLTSASGTCGLPDLHACKLV